MLHPFSYLISLFLVLLMSCRKAPAQSENMPGYDLNHPVKMKLPLQLDEISGLSYYTADSSIFSITDEDGSLYKIRPQGEVVKWDFAEDADYEDLVLIDSSFYVLESNGNIARVRFVNGTPVTDNFVFPGDKNEFETLYRDPVANDIVLICKDCDADKKKSLTTFRFDPATQTFTDSSFHINVKEIDSILGVKKTKFKPSAGAINPVNGLLYIISSINKLIVVTDRLGKVKGCYRISPTVFKQPEGMTFKPDGTLIISNEYAGTGTADLLIFKYDKRNL